MNPFSELDALVEASDNEGLPPVELLLIQQKLAAHRYRLAELTSQLSRKAMMAEVDRKSMFAKTKLTAKAEKIGEKAMTEAAATDHAEQSPTIIRMRAEEIMSQAEYESAKMKLQMSADCLTSLTMRISYLRSEMLSANSIRTT